MHFSEILSNIQIRIKYSESETSGDRDSRFHRLTPRGPNPKRMDV